MSIERTDVVKAAKLARLELTEQEMETFTGQLARIVEYVDKLKQFDASNVEPMMHAAEGALLRDDSKGQTLPRKNALEGAPSSGNSFFRVPPIID